jgi:hypothetical protein
MEIMQIKDCQNILKIGQKLETEEERKCNELFRDKSTIKWLSERKSNLDKEIKEIEKKLKINKDIEQKKEQQQEVEDKIKDKINELKQISDCQEILDLSQDQDLKTEERLKCDKSPKNPGTIEWLKDKKSTLDKEMKEIEDKILEKREVLSKKKLKENEKEKISNELESKTNNLNNIKVAESDKALQVKLNGQINEAEKKIKEHDSTIYDKGQSKYKVDEEIKNKETNVRNWEVYVSSAKSELSSAEIKYKSMMEDPCAHLKKGPFGGKIGCSEEIDRRINQGTTCWKRSPEISSACEKSEKKKVEDKKTTKESKERDLNNAKKALNEEKDKSQIYANGITATNNMKNAEIAKKAQYIKEKQEVEARMKGVLDQKKSLEAEIEKQKAEQILINDALLSLEGSAKNFENDAIYENKKAQYTKDKQEVEAKKEEVLEKKKSLTAEIEKQKAEQILINDALLSLEESAKNFDSDAIYENKKGALEQEFQDAASIRHWVFKYQTTENQGEMQHQQQDL